MQAVSSLPTWPLGAASPAGAPALLGSIREEIQRFNPRLPILSLKLARTLVDDSILTERLIARLATFFGALAAIGLYGVISYTVARRTSEIGVRMALGARQSIIAGMILREIPSPLSGPGNSPHAYVLWGLQSIVAGLSCACFYSTFFLSRSSYARNDQLPSTWRRDPAYGPGRGRS